MISTLPILPILLSLAAFLLSSPPAARDAIDAAAMGSGRDLPPNLLEPIPSRGGLGEIPGADPSLTCRRMLGSPASRAAEDEIKLIRRRWLGSRRDPAMRAEGMRLLREMTAPTSLLPMHALLREEKDDVREFVLEHFASLGSPGQAALACIAIRDADPALRRAAMRRLTIPADPGALAMLDEALRDTTHAVVNHAGVVASHLQALGAIPHLILAQATADTISPGGGAAWIAIGTQISYIANLIPIVGNNAATFQPVPGTVMEGVVLQIDGCVAYSYRVDVHRTLVAMTTEDYGQSTESLGYDPRAWRIWFNEVYVPFNRDRVAALRAIDAAIGTKDEPAPRGS